MEFPGDRVPSSTGTFSGRETEAVATIDLGFVLLFLSSLFNGRPRLFHPCPNFRPLTSFLFLHVHQVFNGLRSDRHRHVHFRQVCPCFRQIDGKGHDSEEVGRLRFQRRYAARFVVQFVLLRDYLRLDCFSFLFLGPLFTILMRIFRCRNASEERVRHFIIRALRCCRLNVFGFVLFRFATNCKSQDIQRFQTSRSGASFLVFVTSLFVGRLHVLRSRLFISGPINHHFVRDAFSGSRYRVGDQTRHRGRGRSSVFARHLFAIFVGRLFPLRVRRARASGDYRTGRCKVCRMRMGNSRGVSRVAKDRPMAYHAGQQRRYHDSDSAQGRIPFFFHEGDRRAYRAARGYSRCIVGYQQYTNRWL